jgi:autotransporter-associated beta strand protein
VGTLVALGNKKLIFGTSHDTTIAGIISGGDGSILKQGSGAVTFMGANTFTGGVVVNSGEIALSSGGSFAPAGLVTLNGSSTFDVSGITPTSTTVGDLTTSLGSTLNLGAKQLIFGTGANTSLLGLVTGSGGSLAKNGNGTVLMAHANTFTGGFLLNAGKLLINDSNALGSGTLTTSDGTGFTLADGIVLENNIDLFSGNTNITVNDSNIAAISGNLTGAGGFIKEGSGTLLWEGVGNYSGTTAVGSGTLKLASGSSIQGPVAVASGAVLQSCGSSGRLLNAGTFILGCSDTTAYINGNAVFNGESTLQVGVGNSSHAALVINGELTIEPGSNVHFVVSSDYNRVNQHFTFVYSNGITGHFEPANILINSPLIVPIITQTGGDLSVGLDLANFSQMITDNNNAVAVGQAIYNLAVEDNPVGDALISSLIGLGRIGEIEDALDQMHPALYKGLTLSQENNAVRIQDTISYRFQQELNEVHCYQYRSKQESAEDPKENDLQRIQKQLKKKVKACEKPKKQTINLWVDGFGDWLGQGAIRFAGSPQLGYQINTGGVTLGLDGNFAKYFYAGAMGGYTGSSADWHDSQSKGTVDTGYAGLYFSGISDMFYGNLSVVGGWSHYSGHRSIIYPGVNETATNSHNGSQILTHAETGVNFGIKGISLRPFDAFDYIAQSEGGFTEKGAGIYNLDVQNTSAIMLRNELGMQFAGCMCFPSSRWTIAPKFSWVLESRTKGKGYVVEFEGTDLSFDITGYFPNRSLFSPGVLISGLMLKDRLSLDLYYNGAFGEKYSENNFGGQIRYGF